MRAVIKEVYYCDYCNKRYLDKGWMRRHEKHCTMNPDRTCRVCDSNGIQDAIEKYKNAYVMKDNPPDRYGFVAQSVEWNKKITIADIRESVDGCPVCILAILRICKLTRYELMEEFKFDYKKEHAEWWAEHSETYSDMENYGDYY